MPAKDVNLKWIVATGITLLTVAAIVMVLIHMYAYLNAPFISPYAAMPTSAAIVVHMDSSFSPASSMLPIEENINKEYNSKFEPLLEKAYSKYHYNRYITNSKICVNFYNGQYGFIWIALVNKDKLKWLEQTISRENLKRINYKDITIYEDADMYFYIYHNLLVASHHTATLRLSVNRLISDTADYLQLPPVNKGMCVSYLPANMAAMSGTGSPISCIDTSLFRQINLYYTLHHNTYTGNADIYTSRKCSRKGFQCDVNNYYDYIPSTASQILIIQENAFQWLQNYNELSIEQNKWMQYFQPQAIACVDIIGNHNQLYHYILLKPKHPEQLAGDMFFLTEKNEETAIGAFAGYDTFMLQNVEVGRVNIPNFIYLRWHIASGLSYMKNYVIMDDYILLAASDYAIQAYLEALQHTLQENRYYVQSDTYFTSQADMLYFNMSAGGVYRLQMEQHDATSCLMHVYATPK